MKKADIFRWLLCLACLTLCASGCGRSEPPRYRLSDEVQDLPPALQGAIERELLRYSGTPLNPRLISDESISQNHLQHGAQVYEYRCAQCHGVTGDGAGAAAKHFNPLPRDYRRGIFKFTSTPYGSIPRREDLIRTIRYGVAGTAMPAFSMLSDRDVEAVVDYVLALTQRGELETSLMIEAESEEEVDPEVAAELAQAVADRWDFGSVEVVRPLTPMPEMTEQTVSMGKDLFLKRECFKCHGKNGRGGSVGGVEVGKDAWGNTTAAADLTSGMLRGGNRPVDIYRRIYSGINGTPMPAFKNVLSEEPDKIWHLVHYILNLSDQRRRGNWFDGEPATESDTQTDDGSTARNAVPNATWQRHLMRPAG